MMKKPFVELVLVGLIVAMLGAIGPVSAQGDDPEKKKEKPTPSLKVGDKAPDLKADKWLQGSEVKEFEKGKIYVVEFWATWCGPCIVMMPHMAEMQAHFKDKGVTFIGYSAMDKNNTEDKVVAFVKKRGPKLAYTFAYSDDRETYNGWMKAANQNGIPCSYVVDREGKIAYIGHPMYLDLVLPKVADGSWKNDDDKAYLDAVAKDVNKVFGAFGPKSDAAAALKTVAEFETKYPQLAHIPYFTGPKLTLLLKNEQFDQARKYAGEVVARALKQDDPLPLRTVSNILRGPSAKDNKELVAMSVTAAEAGLKIAGEKDAMSLLNVAESYFVAGNKARASEFGARAVAAAENETPALRNVILKQAKKFEEKDGE